jgi:hypothetical protein
MEVGVANGHTFGSPRRTTGVAVVDRDIPCPAREFISHTNDTG